jgi:hypothetical protein
MHFNVYGEKVSKKRFKEGRVVMRNPETSGSNLKPSCAVLI